MDPRLEPFSEQVGRPETWPPVFINGVVLFEEDPIPPAVDPDGEEGDEPKP